MLVFHVLSWVHDAPGTRPLWRDVLHDGRFADPLSTAADRLATMGDADRAVFKADGAETRGRYAISEWWLEPHTKGPGLHSHPDDDVFYVLEGTMSIRVGNRWYQAKKGSFVLAPGGVKHDFENRTGKRAGMLNVSVPGDFEPNIPGIAEWFCARSPEDARTERRRRGG